MVISALFSPILRMEYGKHLRRYSAAILWNVESKIKKLHAKL